MSQGCGDIRYSEGGVINGSSVINSQITSSTISSSTLDSCTITNLSSIDAASTLRIVEAISNLTPAQLAELANAIIAALTFSPGTPPTATDNGDIPTVIYGDRSSALGAPHTWAVMGTSFVVPLYQKI